MQRTDTGRLGSSFNSVKLSKGFSFSELVVSNPSDSGLEHSVFSNLNELFSKLLTKVPSTGGFLSYYFSGIQNTITGKNSGKRPSLSYHEQQKLREAKPVHRESAYIYPLHDGRQLQGIIFLNKDAENWQSLNEELVQAYALLVIQNMEMQQKQESLAQYADSLRVKKRKLRKLQQYNQNLLSITTHDLSSPLTAISGYLDIIHQHMNDGKHEKIQQYHQQIQAGVNDVSNMLQQLNDVAKYKKGVLSLNEVKVNACWILSDLCKFLHGSALKKGISLDVELPDHPVYLNVDMVKFKRVLHNLITNAIKYTDAESEILVRLTCEQDQACIRIQDGGIGISEDKLEQIFKPFVKLSEEQASHHSQGLGLYISSYFVDLMGGNIDVKSQPGKGSTFTVTMPRQEDPTAVSYQ